MNTDLLEKKWGSVVRLKKQVMELEKMNKQLKEETVCAKCEALNEMGANMGLGKGQGDGLPREPEKYTLQGHRGKITKLVIHPFYSIVASASEDATVRLWDYESGEQERTLKSHTGNVNYLAFNPNGK
jgi:platelet-activating factor acetylhydrolase IB subunit alpha